MADEEAEGVGLPQKGLNMIIKDVLPDMRIANETRDLLNQCCVEFIKHISREAQHISSKDQRKTIYHDHVQKALKNLGFPREYVDAANSVLGECKIAAEKRLKRKNSRLDKCGIPEEQLWQMQQRLIEQARRNEAEKQQQTAVAQFGGFGGDFQFQLQQQQQHPGMFFHPQAVQQGQQHQFLPPMPVPQQSQMAPTLLSSTTSTANANEFGSSSSNPVAAASSMSSMMMPFGLNPQQMIVPTSSTAMDPSVAAAAKTLFGQQEDRANSQKDGNDEEEEDDDEDYDV